MYDINLFTFHTIIKQHYYSFNLYIILYIYIDSLGTYPSFLLCLLPTTSYYRHDAITQDPKELASQAGVNARDKHLTIFRITDESDGQRPDLLLEGQGKNGQDLLFDITVSHPTCNSYVGRACEERGDKKRTTNI